MSLDDCLVEHGKGGLRGEGTAKGDASLRVGALPEPVFTDSRRGAAKGKDEPSLFSVSELQLLVQTFTTEDVLNSPPDGVLDNSVLSRG